ncbi:MAG: Lrp/AsnC family transcriptional regulator, partial [Oscillospiraceae bacterium]
MEPILMLLDRDARMPIDQIAAAAGLTEKDVEEKIAQYERDGIIRGYKTLIDWDKTDRNLVSARIEVKILLGKSMG